MKALALLILFFLSVPIVSAQPVVVIVRHAEKAANGGNDPDLSSAGRARAEALARILKDSGITANFHQRVQAHPGNRGADRDINRYHGNRCSRERYGRARREVASTRRQRVGCGAWRHNSEHRQSAWNQ